MGKIQNSEIIRQLYLDTASGVQNSDENDSEYNSVYKRFSCLKAFNMFFDTVKAALANYTLSINKIVAEGDRVMVQYTINGIHQADFMGFFPTYQRTAISGIDIFRLNNGKVVEHWDSARQINSIPRPGIKRSKPVRKLSPSGVA